MIILCIFFNQIFVGFEDIPFWCVLIWILSVKEHSRVKLLLLEDIFEEGNQSIILDEYYDASSFLSQADDLSDHFKTCIFELFNVFFVVGCLVIEYDLFLSYLFEDRYTALLLLNDMWVFLNKNLMFKFLEEWIKIIQGLHCPSGYYGQSASTYNLL